MGALALKDGTPTGGIYGFAAIAMELVKDLAPDKVVVAWDKAKTSTSKRKAIFVDYKAGRVKQGEDFYVQIPLLKELIGDLGWSFVECDDYEADDIIGTLAKQADDEGDYMTYIISSDLDMLQIVDENTRMYRILKGFTDLEEIDVRVVEEKYGIRKTQFLDLKALKGDASDNIPGVPGIGEKTAVKLLNEFGTLENIYENIEKIAGATQKKLVEGKESAIMSKKLAQIMFDAPVKLADIPNLDFEPARAKEGLLKLEFRSLVKKFDLVGEEVATAENVAVDADEIKRKMHEDETYAEEILYGDGLKKILERAGNDKIKAEFDIPLIPVLYKMEKEGMRIDREYFSRLKEEYAGEVRKLERKIFELGGGVFNVNSPIQLSDVLFNKLKLPTQGIKKKTRAYSTGAKELEKLKDLHPIIPAIMEYREAMKLLSTYISPLSEMADENSRIHTTFTQDVTATGRLSSVNPNLQNIPVRTDAGKKIREGFVAGEGNVLVSADYAQFELRLAAVLSNDEALIKDFNEGIDIHTKTAAEVFGVKMDEITKAQRRAAKVINFGVLYGMSAKGLADATGMTMIEAKDFIDEYFKLRAPIKNKLDSILAQARNEGYVETFFGRRRLTPDVKAANFLVRAAAERAAQNMPIQGTEADLMKRAMILVDKELPEGAKLVMQVHDSLIVECKKELEEEVKKTLKWTMENIAPELKIKLAVDVTSGRNWGEL